MFRFVYPNFWGHVHFCLLPLEDQKSKMKSLTELDGWIIPGNLE